MQVYLIGCGPGDPELLTLKAARLIPACDAIVYDDLIPDAALALARPDAERHYVGKRAGRDYLKQPEINALLLELARRGLKVARLKGGDPCLFGRGGEEALYLAENGVSCEVVPGLSSALAGLEYAGIPPTHRGLAASLKFVTGHEDPEKNSGFLNWSLLARESGTLVFLMGATRIAKIAQNLMDEGMDPATPAALIENATLPQQRHVLATLAGLSAAAAEHAIVSPCLIVVGQVAALSAQLYRPEAKPLSGRRILLTRPEHMSAASIARFAAAGAEVSSYPLIELKPLDFELPAATSFDAAIFTSQNAVTLFFERLHSAGLDSRYFGAKQVYCIGPKTSAALQNYGIMADGQAGEYRAEGIVAMLADKAVQGQRFLLPRAESARPYLKEALTERDAHVNEIKLYATIKPAAASRAGLLEALAKVDTVVFTSPSGARHAAELLDSDLNALAAKTIAAIGPVTADELARLKIPATITAGVYTDEGLIEALTK